jgi:oligoendopeptidase F
MPASAKRTAPSKGTRLTASLAAQDPNWRATRAEPAKTKKQAPKAGAKSASKRASKPAAKAASKTSSKNLGPLPEWNLTDLYAGLDDPRVKRDLDRADEYCKAFEDDFKGKLAAIAERPDGGSALAQAVIRYEQLDDLLGRLGSFAGLVYAQNTVDPARAKFHGDVQERLTAASTHLLFFQLELNRLDDAVLEAAMREPKLGHYRPWLEDIRKEKPYQLEDRIEQLFHEKSVTTYSAWNRLFDETIALAAFVQSGRARGGGRAGDSGARRLSAAVASLLRAQGALVRQEEARALGPQRAAAQGRGPHHRLA